MEFMDFLMIFVKAIVITFFIYGVISFIFNVIEERSIRKYDGEKFVTDTKQSPSKEQVDLNPMEFPASIYTETKDTAIPPSYPPRSTEDMELS